MKKKSIHQFVLTLLSISSITLSCGNKQNQTENSEGLKIIAVDELELTEPSDFFDEVSYTSLDLPVNMVISNVDKLVAHGDNIYIFDYNKSKRLYSFDQHGNFQFAIDKDGYGPGEYKHTNDFIVTDTTIEVLDSRNKIIYFNKQGEFLKEIKLPINSIQFVKTSPTTYLLYNKELGSTEFGENIACDIAAYDIISNSFECILEKTGSPTIFTREFNNLNHWQDVTFFSKSFMDTIFSIQQNKTVPKYILDFGDKAIPKDKLNPEKSSYIDIINYLNQHKEMYKHTPGLFANDEYLVSQFNQNGLKYLFLNRSTGETHILSGITRTSGLNLLQIQGIQKDQVLSVMFPEYLVEAYEKHKNDKSVKISKSFEAFAKKLKPEGPLVLIKHSLK